MDMFNRWRRGEGAGRGVSLFEPWPGPPIIRSIPAGRSAPLGPLSRTAEGRTDPDKYSPALVIGLGPTGARVLDALGSELALDSAGPQQLLRLALLTTSASPAMSTAVPLRRFDLDAREPVVPRTGQSTSVRAPLLERFLQPGVYDSVVSYFRGAQSDLRAGRGGEQDMRIIVVGGLGEPEIGLLGNLMLILLQSGGGRGVSKRVVLLAINPAAPQLEAAEETAVLRELSRLTFLGPHVMPHQASQPDSTAANALVDYLLLVQNAGGLQADRAGTPPSFDQSVGQAMTELAYMLLHPSGGRLWAGLQNDLETTGNMRAQTHAAYVYGAGAATLFVPVTELQAYIAARLAIAAVFGEQRDSPEGLLGRRTPPINHEAAGISLARGWLQDAPLAHRLLSGLLDASGPDAFHHPPPVGNDQAAFVALLPAQAAHGLVALLNDGQPDALERAEAGLAQLKRYVANWLNWCRSAAGPHPSDSHRTLLHVMEQWQLQIDDLHRQLMRWRTVLGSSDAAPAAASTSGATAHPSAPSTRGGWPLSPLGDTPVARTPLPPLSNLPPLSSAADWSLPPLSGGRAAPAAVPSTLYDLLQRRLTQAQGDLQAITGGAARRPLTADQSTGYDGLSEAEKYYRDTVRPELEQFLSDKSPAFRAVTQRLRWWIKLTRSAPPELLLLCLPVSAALPADAPLPLDAAVFSPAEVERLVVVLLDIAAVQTQKTAENLTANWMLGRLEASESRDFLRRVESVYLDIDGELARAQHQGTLATRPYLIGPDETAIGAVAENVFPAVAANVVEHIVNSEPTRVSALLLQTDVPISAIRLPKSAQQTYGHNAGLYLYEQERLAAQYEGQARGAARSFLFPPDFVVALTQADLVRLFCHGVLAGLIAVRQPNPLREEEFWTVPYNPSTFHAGNAWLPWDRPRVDGQPSWSADEALAEESDPGAVREELLSLAPHQIGREWQSLWAAMRAFTLDIPFGQSLDGHPIHPFHRDNRDEFLARLRQAIVASRESVAGEADMSRRAASLRVRLENWRHRADNDALAQAFCNVLEIELDRPGSL